MEQHANDVENAEDKEVGWTRVNDQPLLAPFTGTPGLTADLPDDPQTIDFFYLLFQPDMWNIIVEQTNKYAQNRIDNQELRAQSRLKKW